MVLAKSKNQVGLGRAIINKKAKEARQPRESQRYTTDAESKLTSVTQERDLDEFLNTAQLAATDFTAEKQNVRIVHTPTVGSTANPFLLTSEEEREALRKHWELRSHLRVPRRPPWTKEMTPGQLEQKERTAFLEWRRSLAQVQESENLLLTPFERNIEVWKQLWRVLERSHLIVQIVDARNPLRFRCEDLESYIKDVEGPEGEAGTGANKRRSLLLINKSDLLTRDQRERWAEYFDKLGIKYAFFSAANARALQEARREAESQADEEDHEVSGEGSEDEGSEADQKDSLASQLDALGLQPTADEAEPSANESGNEESSEDNHHFNPISTDPDEDPRTRVLSVLELESLFVRSAPSLGDFADKEGNAPSRLVVGLVGYPNVGKSSTINSLIGEKKVSVSSTPGKTKHFQTIQLSPTMMLCDCPGLVFPQFATTKADLICDGVLPIDQMREHSAPVALIAQRIPRDILEGTYGLTIRRRAEEEGGGDVMTAEDLLTSYAVARGFTKSGVGNPDEARAARYLLKDYVNAKLLYCHPPPEVDSEGFNETSRDQNRQYLSDIGKKMAPVTRVKKGADTFIEPEPAHLGLTPASSRTAQSGRSRALDNAFFESQSELAARPFVQGSARNGTSFSRTKLYPHQNIVTDDGTVLSGQQARVASVLTAAGGDIRGGKKHHKGRRTKLRTGTGTMGYD